MNNDGFVTKMQTLSRLPATRFLAVILIIGTLGFSDALAVQKKSRKTKIVQKTKRLTRQEIQDAEQRLADLGYWTGPIDGKFDADSRDALIAFQKVERREPTGRLTLEELTALNEAKRPKPRDASYGHVEVDLSRQVLFVVDENGEVSKVLPVSSGSGEEFTSEGWTRDAITPVGRFKVHNKIDGWHKAPLGMLYYPVYYLGGIAVHGSNSVPVHPASHGCVRIPVFAAKEFNEMTAIGTWIIVYDDQTTNMPMGEPGP